MTEYLNKIYYNYARNNHMYSKILLDPKINLQISQELATAVKFNNMFDMIYVINLDTRTDRWAIIQKTFAKWNIYNYQRVQGIVGKDEPHYSEWLAYFKAPKLYPYEKKKYGRKSMKMPGSLGILKTNKIILEDALHNNYKSILVLQDDIIMGKDFYNKFNMAYESIMHVCSQPKLIFLGAMQHRWNDIKINPDLPWYKTHTSTEGAFAVIINDCKEEMLEFINNYIMPIDSGALSYIQDKYPELCFVMYPNVMISDIRNSDLRPPRFIEYAPFKWNLSLYDEIG